MGEAVGCGRGGAAGDLSGELRTLVLAVCQFVSRRDGQSLRSTFSVIGALAGSISTGRQSVRQPRTARRMLCARRTVGDLLVGGAAALTMPGSPRKALAREVAGVVRP